MCMCTLHTHTHHTHADIHTRTHNNNNNNKSGFKEPSSSSNQTPLKTLYNDGKKKEKKSEKNIYVCKTDLKTIYICSRITHTHTHADTRTHHTRRHTHTDTDTLSQKLSDCLL